MALTHLIFGILMFVGFLITGQFMRFDFPDKDAISQELRLLMRSRHIYILLAGLIHVGLGIYFRPHEKRLRRMIQYLGSTALFAAGFVYVWAFYQETYFLQRFSDFSRNAIYLTLFGAALHVFGGIELNRYKN